MPSNLKQLLFWRRQGLVYLPAVEWRETTGAQRFSDSRGDPPSLVKQDVKTADAELVRLQAFVHDPVAPLLQLVHAMDDESVFTLPWTKKDKPVQK